MFTYGIGLENHSQIDLQELQIRRAAEYFFGQ